MKSYPQTAKPNIPGPSPPPTEVLEYVHAMMDALEFEQMWTVKVPDEKAARTSLPIALEEDAAQ